MRINKTLVRGFGVAAVLSVSATPAVALGLGDLAKVVLGGNSILKKGQDKCGQSLGLTSKDSLAMTFARAAVEKSLPLSQLATLDSAADASANTAAQSPAFCAETKAKKPSMMKAITKAGKSILKSGALGGLKL